MQNLAIHETRPDENLVLLSKDIDAFECYANTHAARIAAVSDAIAKSFHLSSHDRQILREAALIHDVGEMVMDRSYISAGRDLTVYEREDLHRHPVIGEQEAAKLGVSRGTQLLVRWHHEWWDGSGYPDAISGDRIPLAARILRAADTYCALTDSRPHRKAFSAQHARKYLAEWAGIELDPKVVRALLRLEDLPELNSFTEDSGPEAAQL
ncbi:MAG: HD domain-containing phosphohydrolase [Pyrinomonadaceae bacterium]